jgi:hypothetical protein
MILRIMAFSNRDPVCILNALCGVFLISHSVQADLTQCPSLTGHYSCRSNTFEIFHDISILLLHKGSSIQYDFDYFDLSTGNESFSEEIVKNYVTHPGDPYCSNQELHLPRVIDGDHFEAVFSLDQNRDLIYETYNFSDEISSLTRPVVKITCKLNQPKKSPLIPPNETELLPEAYDYKESTYELGIKPGERFSPEASKILYRRRTLGCRFCSYKNKDRSKLVRHEYSHMYHSID